MVVPIIVRNVLTRTPARLFIEQSCLFNLSEQIWWNKVVKVIQICFSCSMSCMDGLLLHLYARGSHWSTRGLHTVIVNLGTQIWESHHKSSAQGALKPNTPPLFLVHMPRLNPPPLFAVCTIRTAPSSCSITARCIA